MLDQLQDELQDMATGAVIDLITQAPAYIGKLLKNEPPTDEERAQYNRAKQQARRRQREMGR